LLHFIPQNFWRTANVGGNKLWPLQDSKNLWAGGQENYQKPKQTILNYLKMIAIAN